jgi:putative transcriptional regulator
MRSPRRARASAPTSSRLSRRWPPICGEVEAESYEVPDDVLTPERVKAIRRKVAASTKEFERRFRISARTMEAYEQGRRRPDAAMQTLLKVIEREPEAVRRALAS